VEPLRPWNFGVGTWIERRARSAPDRPALITADGVRTYAALAERIRRLASAFRRMGVGHGDRIAWLGENHPTFLEALFAAGRIGAVLAPVNHYLPDDERAAVVADADPVVVLEHVALPKITFAASVLHRIAVGGSRAGAVEYESLVAETVAGSSDAAVDLDDLLFLPHTTGTTGHPKGVMLTHANVTWNVINFLTSAEFRNDDVTIAFAPFFRVGGTGVNVLPVLFMGGTVVVPDDVKPDRMLALIERHRVTVGFAGPGLLEGLAAADRWSSADLSSLRFVLTGGAPVPDRLVRVYAKRGVPLLQGYGLSEAGPLALLLDAPSALEKIGSAGRPPAFVDVRIVDADGRDVPSGATGELHVRGPNVMAGYWRRPDATREVLLDGAWLRTGDAARMDAEGYIWIVDRFADRLETAGGVVFPGDVERVLLSHPAVVDAGVVGVPSPDGSQVGAGFVVLASGAATTSEELIERARRELPDHAVPATIRQVSELPRNSVGKLLRQQLREI
jgi:fatty-acyl-CoA synthase